MRQIVLDTETTGLDPQQGHRVIEIGCIELVGRRVTGQRFHCYLNPQREIDSGAIDVHGLTNEFLADKPLFGDIVDELLAFIRDSQLVIHNASFDVGFLNAELGRLGGSRGLVTDACTVLDTLALARQRHPGQRNSLDALCKRYGIDNAHRTLHGALLDAEILADVYLAMTGGQVDLGLGGDGAQRGAAQQAIRRLASDRPALPVIAASAEELARHEQRLVALDGGAGRCVWQKLTAQGDAIPN